MARALLTSASSRSRADANRTILQNRIALLKPLALSNASRSAGVRLPRIGQGEDFLCRDSRTEERKFQILSPQFEPSSARGELGLGRPRDAFSQSIWLGQSLAWAEFLRRILPDPALVEIGARCECFEQARARLRAGAFQVLVMDWTAGEHEPPERLIASIRESCSSIGLIAVTSNWRLSECVAAFDSGVDDYVSSDIDPREFSARLRAAVRRRGVIGTEAQNLEVRAARLGRDYGLSPREREILTLVASGVHLKQIGDALGCNYSTVRTHVRRLCAKLGCSGSREAIVKFFSSGQVRRS